MRGKEVGDTFSDVDNRITPAHAGKSIWDYKSDVFNRDHPRTCGEKKFLRKQRAKVQGSPPHMRGKEETEENVLQKERITPAHAGKSPFLLQTLVLLTGSPPHMRGKVVYYQKMN